MDLALTHRPQLIWSQYYAEKKPLVPMHGVVGAITHLQFAKNLHSSLPGQKEILVGRMWGEDASCATRASSNQEGI
jgi:hypothetical protein